MRGSTTSAGGTRRASRPRSATARRAGTRAGSASSTPTSSSRSCAKRSTRPGARRDRSTRWRSRLSGTACSRSTDAGRPLTAVSTWRDTRAAADAEELAGRLDAGDVHRRTGCPLHPSFWPARLARLRREEPDVFRAAARFVSFPDYVLRPARGRGADERLHGVGDRSMARRRRVGRGAARRSSASRPERLPEVSGEPVGARRAVVSSLGRRRVRERRRRLRHARAGGAHDRDVGRLPRRPRRCGGRAAARPLPLPRGRAPGRRRAARSPTAATSGTGSSGRWPRPTTEGLAEEPADGHGLTFLALLGGERSPGWDARTRGAVTGLSLPHRPARARARGARRRRASASRRSPISCPRCARWWRPGAALLKNPDWIQIVADVLGRPVQVSGVSEASARGAAVLALERLGLAADPAPVAEEVRPRDDRTRIYGSARRRQRALYDAIARPPLRRE